MLAAPCVAAAAAAAAAADKTSAVSLQTSLLPAHSLMLLLMLPFITGQPTSNLAVRQVSLLPSACTDICSFCLCIAESGDLHVLVALCSLHVSCAEDYADRLCNTPISSEMWVQTVHTACRTAKHSCVVLMLHRR